MKSRAWAVSGAVGWGVVGLLACGRASPDDAGNTEPPGTRAGAVRAVAADNCDHYASCGEVGPGQGYSDRASCLMARERFWSDKWPAERCEGHLDGPNLQACRDALRDISCMSLVDEFRVIRSQCDPSTVCRAP